MVEFNLFTDFLGSRIWGSVIITVLAGLNIMLSQAKNPGPLNSIFDVLTVVAIMIEVWIMFAHTCDCAAEGFGYGPMTEGLGEEPEYFRGDRRTTIRGV